MRVSERYLESEIKSVLSERISPTLTFEEELFSSADVLLEKRRDFTQSQAFRRETTQQLGSLLGQFVELLSSHPLTHSVTALALLTIVVLGRNYSQKPTLPLADLPEFPQINNASAKYEAIWLAERNAYDKEVEDADRESNNGI